MEKIESLDVYLKFATIFLIRLGYKIRFFLEIVISAVNLIVDSYRASVGYDCIDELYCLRMSKRFMERSHHKKALTSIIFQGVLSDEHISFNEE